MANGAGFQGLISGAIGRDLEMRGRSHLSESLPLALQQIENVTTAKRTEAASARNVARSAVYQQRPELAAKHLGIEYPERIAPEIGEGYRKPKLTVDERGNVISTYEPTPQLDQEFFAKEYNKWGTAIDELNTNRAIMGQPEIPKLTFKKWLNTNFPDYAEEILTRDKGKKKKEEEEGTKSIKISKFDLTAEGAKYAENADALIAYYQAENPTLSEQEIVDAMKSQRLIQ